MATVSKWTPFGVALDLTATGANVTRISATRYTVSVTASWEVYYSGAQTNYGMTASSGGVTKTISAFDGTKRSKGSTTFTGTYSISGNGSATKTVTVTFKNFNTDNGDSASKSVSFNVTVPAWTSYTIKYNANGGSGAPGNQTKWKDQTLKLSTTKPIRTGYSFLGWSTSSTATTATYAAGANYTANAAATLYAVWKANTYTVKYDANGGSGAPASQTKTYGKTLTLSTTVPTRTNYEFLGWATSASSTSVAYAAGANYTANSAITLYAVWQLSYVKPRISNVSTVRCDSGGTAADEGQNGLVTFDWECDKEVSSITIKWKLASTSTWTSVTVSASGTSGRVSHVIGTNDLDVESTYDVHITVTDSGGSSYALDSLTSMRFAIDFLDGGKGVAIGKTAELENMVEFEFDVKFNGKVIRDQNILWEGALFMTGSHSIELSERISEQMNGIVLVFSRYSSNTAQNYHFNTHFVPKKQIAIHGGCGHLFLMSTDGTFSLFGCKYLYIHDDHIAGNDNNNTSGTGSCGINYSNSGFVLRYVIGV